MSDWLTDIQYKALDNLKQSYPDAFNYLPLYIVEAYYRRKIALTGTFL